MAWCVGDDELALLGGEKAVGDIDGDALLPLGGQAVHEKREVERTALGSPLARIGLDGRQLILEKGLGVVQQPADQGALAVIDAAARDEAQHRLVFVLPQILVDVGRNEVFGKHAAPRYWK